MHDSITATKGTVVYDFPLELLDAVPVDEWERYQAETDCAPPADSTQDADIEEMSIEDIEDELYRLIFWMPAGY